ncbi:hypothetical protein DERP_005621 [Dermatophagoides pteronyssinus]|uniref:Uncharacterized protein n=1 Tax=Dermatophagoides pteronyssinus TaxID=6956 RepID=A0ABQ8J946_DERPT|nr:hypothetical protein DERP_005621 [Dermatophagoides pteronyssinus]
MIQHREFALDKFSSFFTTITYVKTNDLDYSALIDNCAIQMIQMVLNSHDISNYNGVKKNINVVTIYSQHQLL